MKVPDEFAVGFAAFPAALRELVEAELESGNTIAAIEHGFPAAPCGASIKLTRPVEAGRRKSSDGVSFYARNHPAYSGEFTTSERHFFVLEPPAPPAPAPDMDAIQSAQESTSDPLTRLAQRKAGSGVEIALESLSAVAPSPVTSSGAPWRGEAPEPTAPGNALTVTETATGAERSLYFRDKRPPHHIQFALERMLMALFAPSMENGRLSMRTSAMLVGCRYQFELRFLAASSTQNHFSLRVEASWAAQAATQHEYFQRTSSSWFSFWTRELQPSRPPTTDTGSPERYRELCEAALRAEAHLETIPAIQRAILAAMKLGATFATSHKEGGTNIHWRKGRFARTDYGENPGQQDFDSDEEFLTFLRQFYDWETSKNAPSKVPEADVWKLILRLMRTE